MPRSPLLVVLFFAFAGCGSTTPSPGPSDARTGPLDAAPEDAQPVAATDGGDPAADTASATDAGPLCTSSAEVVTLTTSDAIQLEADLRVGGAGSPTVVLLHMIPPSNSRTNYPPELIEALVQAGFTVLNVDRRGAGGSGGTARDAYIGPGGALDVAAAVDFLSGHPCRLDLGRLTLVGASNGTTSALDYAVTHGDRPAPARVVFLTGGRYTEAQHALRASQAALPQLLFVWDRGEQPAKTWAEGFQSGAPVGWQFDEYTGGGHGTRLLGRANPEAIDRIVAWVQGS